MGKSVVRLRDLCTGHHCFPPRPTVTASPDVFVNKRGHHRQGDWLAPHCCGSCHPSPTCGGSSTVFVNGMPAARVTDAVCCGSLLMTGSTNVFERD